MEVDAADVKAVDKTIINTTKHEIAKALSLQNNSFYDDESDDNINDINVEDMINKLEATTRLTFNETRCCFNLSPRQLVFADTADDDTEVLDIYKDVLEKKKKQWTEFLATEVKRFQETRRHPAVLSSEPNLSEADKLYLNHAPNLQSFIRKSLAFMKTATYFIEVEHSEIHNLQQSIMNSCQYHLNTMACRRIAENLANAKK